jgi:hypothetical protein
VRRRNNGWRLIQKERSIFCQERGRAIWSGRFHLRLTNAAPTLTINLTMYRRPKFLELLLEIREEMAREADLDIDQFVQNLNREPRAEKAKSAATAANARLNGSEMKKAVARGRKR